MTQKKRRGRQEEMWEITRMSEEMKAEWLPWIEDLNFHIKAYSENTKG